MTYVKPTILISACLNQAKCRYDGERVNDDFINLLEPHVNFINVCPEVAIGLGIPRESLRLVKKEETIHMIQNKTELDVTEQIVNFSNTYTNQIKDTHGYIFKTKSPSCGVNDAKMYNQMGRVANIGKINGLFVDAVLKKYGDYPIIDEGRLNDYNIREHFLTRIFLLSSFDEMMKTNSLSELQKFHHQNKMLLLSYNVKGLNELGKIVADSTKKAIQSNLIQYKNRLLTVTNKRATIKSKANVFLHTFGQLSHHLESSEKSFVLETLEQYRNGQIPFSSLLLLLKGYAIRFDEQKVLEQSFFNPFPKELIVVRDSGKQII